MCNLLARHKTPDILRNRSKVKRGARSPLKKIYSWLPGNIKERTKELEHIPPYAIPPWEHTPEVYIEETAEKAMKQHEKDRQDTNDSMHIYTDASGKNKQIAAAAVCPETGEEQKRHMGDNNTTTIFAAELRGIALATTIAVEATERGTEKKKIIIYTDSQGAAKALKRPAGKSGVYLLIDALRLIKSLREQGKTVQIKWIPSHEKIPGNERADTLARGATTRNDNALDQEVQEHRVPIQTKAGLRTLIRQEALQRWQSEWENEKTGRATYRHTPKPTTKVLKLQRPKQEGQRDPNSIENGKDRTQDFGCWFWRVSVCCSSCFLVFPF